MTVPLRHVPVPGTSPVQAGETWFVHSERSLFIIAVEPANSVIKAINLAHQGATGLDLCTGQS
ncbi:hypothetical protein [Microvirga yunnanensis]|uniref:hypothetical protein n=1 Tax=Microvirga yunnanensis TaxID=2953740 RepID=UPI0021C5A89D|nr:hypothetical protein [Microvirga sp. HBU65207]